MMMVEVETKEKIDEDIAKNRLWVNEVVDFHYFKWMAFSFVFDDFICFM